MANSLLIRPKTTAKLAPDNASSTSVTEAEDDEPTAPSPTQKTAQPTKSQPSEAAKALQAQRERRRLIDELLKATGGNIPALFNEVNQSLRGLMAADKSLELTGGPDFTKPNESFRIPSYTSLKLDGSANFFGMDVGEQELLYEQVGLFKGIVVDHSKENPVQPGYRDVLKYRVETGRNNPATSPTRVFHKKPALSGFFETTYAADEKEAKQQQSGIFNLGFGLSASYSTFFTSASMRAGFSYGKDWHQERAAYSKTVIITSNFFLPKVELSFDTLYPCASDDFTAAVEGVFRQPREQQFSQLVQTLQHYGHFVATNLVVGGRLYSTETKHLSKESSLENVVTKYAANFQAAVSTLRFEAGIEAKMSHESSDKNATNETHEKQSLQLRAVGGEGAYLHSSAQWVESLAKFPNWGLVRFDNLVPSLDTLPVGLQEQCHALLISTVTDTATSVEGLREQGADFLFYQGYLEKYGSRAQPRYFVLKGTGTGRKVLTIAPGDKANDKEVSLKNYEGTAAQEWWYLPNGKIYARNEGSDTDLYVLSVATVNNNSKLVITQEDYFDNQTWKFARGYLKNEGLDCYVEFGDNNEVVVGGKEPRSNRRNMWQTLTGQQLNRIREVKPRNQLQQASGNPVTLLKEGYYLDKTQSLSSLRGTAKLVFQAGQLVIQLDSKTLWSWPAEKLPSAPTFEKLYLENGNLFVLDSTGHSHYLYGVADTVPLAGGDSLELLDNGNLELLTRDNRTVWESNSIVYSVIQRDDSDSVLTVHHSDFAPSMDYPVILLTTLPFVGADHQLWYQNRNRQLICKAQPDPQTRMAIVCEEKGGLQVVAENYRAKDQQWSVDQYATAAILNETRSRYLSYSDDGKIMSGSTSAQSSWKLLPRPAYRADVTRKLQLKHPVRIDKKSFDRGYEELKSAGGYIHLDQFALEPNNIAPGSDSSKIVLDRNAGNSAGIVLRGLRLTNYGNRLALQAIVQNDQYLQSKVWDEGKHFEALSKDVLYFSKAPVYLPETVNKQGAVEKIGLHKGKNYYCLKAKASANNVTLENLDDDRRLQLIKKDGDKEAVIYFETTEVVAADGEQVVGFGFTVTYNNRLSPYLLVMPTEPAKDKA